MAGFIAAAARHNIPLCCIDRLQARRDWRRGLTGNEALLKQRQELLKDSEYMMHF